MMRHCHPIEIAQIVAISENHAIGKDNQLPWHIPADLQHFKRLTSGGIVIMGRKTFESMGAKPLPNRLNFVITTNQQYQTSFDNVKIFHQFDDAIQDALSQAIDKQLSTIWVIGGEKIFELALPISDRLEITHVQTVIDNANAFYPQIPNEFEKISQNPTQVDEKTGLVFEFASYQRKI